VLILTSPVNIRYFSDVELETYERFAALLICGSRRVFVVPKLEEGRVPGPAYVYSDGEDPAEALRRAAQECGGGEVEVDGRTTLRAWEVVRRALGGISTYKIADEYIDGLRAVKRSDEVERIAKAAQAIREAIAEAYAELSPGVPERKAAADIYLRLAEGEARRHFRIVKEADEIAVPPRNFVLLTTEEYVKMPNDVVGLANLRSTLARYGLVIPPTVVDAGFEGNITIEVVNESPNTIVLRPGLRFLHLILVRAEGAAKYLGTYLGQRGVTPPKGLKAEC